MFANAKCDKPFASFIPAKSLPVGPDDRHLRIGDRIQAYGGEHSHLTWSWGVIVHSVNTQQVAKEVAGGLCTGYAP